MVHLRDEALRQVTELKSLKAGTLAIAAHESAAVYLLPAPLRAYLQKFPDIKVGIYRSRLNEIPRQVMDREVDVGFVKDEPAFHELQWVDVHSDEMVCIVSPRHPLASKTEVRIRDLGSEQFVLHHLCSTTAETILRLFDQNGTRCRIVAELWSFENIKSFVQEEVGMAIVPGITVRQELRDGTLVRIPLRELRVPRRTLMIYREQGYVSDTARELIKIVRAFNWDQGFSDKPSLRPIAAMEPTELRNRIRRISGVRSFRVKVREPELRESMQTRCQRSGFDAYKRVHANSLSCQTLNTCAGMSVVRNYGRSRRMKSSLGNSR